MILAGWQLGCAGAASSDARSATEHLVQPHTTRFGSTAKVRAECKLKYYRFRECLSQELPACSHLTSCIASAVCRRRTFPCDLRIPLAQCSRRLINVSRHHAAVWISCTCTLRQRSNGELRPGAFRQVLADSFSLWRGSSAETASRLAAPEHCSSRGLAGIITSGHRPTGPESCFTLYLP